MRWRITSLLLNLAHAIDHLMLLVFATAVAAIAHDFGVGRWEDLMPYTTGAFLMFGIGSFPSGRLGDLWGRRAMMLVFFFGMGASALLIALTRNVWQLALALGLMGAFASIYHPVGIPMLLRHARKPGITIGINGMAGNLGIAAAAYARGTMSAPDAVIALNGAVLQMFNHGLSAAGMFLLVGVVYERTHTRDLRSFGGLFPLAPVYGGILIFTSLASLGLPGLGGFVSEFMVVRGAWPVFTVITALAMIGLLVTGAYILKGIGQTLHGPLNPRWVGHKLEISAREVVAIAPLMALMVVIGVWPGWLVNVINETITRLMG